MISRLIKYFQKQPHPRLVQGFTLVELLVTLSIFVVITTLTLTKHNQFTNGILLTNAAYDVALAVRTAQAYGINVQGKTGAFTVPYGVRFESGSGEKNFLVFADTNNNRIYNGNGGSNSVIGTCNNECIEKFAFRRGAVVKEIRACNLTSGSGINRCSESTEVDSVDIIFRRPNPDALIYVDGDSTSYGHAEIIVASPGGAEAIIQVFDSGQISIER